MKITLTRNALFTIFGVLGLGAALAIGLLVGRMSDQTAEAPGVARGDLAAPLGAPPQANPEAPGQAPAVGGGLDGAMDPVLAGGDLTPEQDLAVQRIGVADAAAKLDQDNVVWVDTRTAGEYAESRISGALNFPAYEADSQLNQLPQGSEIIVYCA